MKYKELIKNLQQDSNTLDKNISILKADLEKLTIEIAQAQARIQRIQNEFKEVTDALVSIDDVQATTIAVRVRIEALTPQLKKLEESIVADVKEFTAQSKKLRDTLGVKRDLVLMNLRWHIVFMVLGIVGCWFFHWGLYGLGRGYYQRGPALDPPISFVGMFTVMIPPERYKRIVPARPLPKFVNWYLEIIAALYVLVLTTAVFIS